MPTAHRPRFWAVGGLKGGSAKTCVGVNLGAGLALKGRKVLLLDCDPLAAATYHVTAEAPEHTLADALAGLVPLAETLTKTAVEGLTLAPGSREMAPWDRKPERLSVQLARVLDQVPAGTHDVLLDLPPSAGAIVRAVLANLPGGRVLAPVQARVLDLLGLADLEQLMEELREQNGDLRLAGVIPTRVNRTKLAEGVLEGLREAHGRKVLPGIPESAAVARAPMLHRPVLLTAPKSPGAEAFRALTQALIRLEAIL